jgi:hypothetical protein
MREVSPPGGQFRPKIRKLLIVSDGELVVALHQAYTSM